MMQQLEAELKKRYLWLLNSRLLFAPTSPNGDPFSFTCVPNSVALKGWKRKRLYLGQMH